MTADRPRRPNGQWAPTVRARPDETLSAELADPHTTTDPGPLGGLAAQAPTPATLPVDPNERLDLATRWPPAEPEVLAALIGDIRLAVAENQVAGPATLDRLAGDERADVRRAVACRSDTAPATLTRLAADPDPRVRAAAADNPNTSRSGRSAGGLLVD